VGRLAIAEFHFNHQPIGILAKQVYHFAVEQTHTLVQAGSIQVINLEMIDPFRCIGDPAWEAQYA
jgi:hypothetical protein